MIFDIFHVKGASLKVKSIAEIQVISITDLNTLKTDDIYNIIDDQNTYVITIRIR